MVRFSGKSFRQGEKIRRTSVRSRLTPGFRHPPGEKPDH